MTNVRIIKTSHFTLSAKYVSSVLIKDNTKKRFLRKSIYTSEIVIQYYNELNEYMRHTMRIETRIKSNHQGNLNELFKIKEYIEMDMGSSAFPVEYSEQRQQQWEQDIMSATLEFLRRS
jgi:hypothetical protein